MTKRTAHIEPAACATGPVCDSRQGHVTLVEHIEYERFERGKPLEVIVRRQLYRLFATQLDFDLQQLTQRGALDIGVAVDASQEILNPRRFTAFQALSNSSAISSMTAPAAGVRADVWQELIIHASPQWIRGRTFLPVAGESIAACAPRR